MPKKCSHCNKEFSFENYYYCPFCASTLTTVTEQKPQTNVLNNETTLSLNNNIKNPTRITIDKLIASGATDEDLKKDGYTIDILKIEGFTVAELKSIGFTLQEFKDAGYAVNELDDDFDPRLLVEKGYTIKDFMDANYSPLQLRPLCFSPRSLVDVGYPLTLVVEAYKDGFIHMDDQGHCYKVYGLRDGGITATELKSINYSIHDLVNLKYSAKELVDAGFKAGDILYYGFSPNELRDAGFTAKKLIDSGISKNYVFGVYSIRELKECGISCQDPSFPKCSDSDLVNAGYSAEEIGRPCNILLSEITITAEQLRSAGFNIHDFLNEIMPFINSHYIGRMVNRLVLPSTSFSGKYEAKEVLNKCKELLRKTSVYIKDAGFNEQEINDAGFTINRLKDAGFPASFLKYYAGFTDEEMRRAGFTDEDMEDNISFIIEQWWAHLI